MMQLTSHDLVTTKGSSFRICAEDGVNESLSYNVFCTRLGNYIIQMTPAVRVIKKKSKSIPVTGREGP
jgi:hypothetical protein